MSRVSIAVAPYGDAARTVRTTFLTCIFLLLLRWDERRGKAKPAGTETALLLLSQQLGGYFHRHRGAAGSVRETRSPFWACRRSRWTKSMIRTSGTIRQLLVIIYAQALSNGIRIELDHIYTYRSKTAHLFCSAGVRLFRSQQNT